MEVRVSLDARGGEGSAEDLRSLRRWLTDEPGLRGRVSAVHQPPAAGTLGPTLEAILVALSPESVASVLAVALVSWLHRRREKTTAQHGTTLRVTRADGGSFELRADGLSAAELRVQVEQLASALVPPPGRDGDEGIRTDLAS